MYGGGGGDGGARAAEQARQAAINQGMERIDATFAGTRGAHAASQYVPGTTYYDEFGQPWTPSIPEAVHRPEMVNGRDMSAQTPAQKAAATQAATDKAYQDAIAGGKLFTGTETSGGFDDKFYQQRADDYEKYATPQFEQQYQATRNSLAANLARHGLLKSGAAIKANASLDQTATTQKNNIANQALNEENTLRTDVEGQRTQLVNQLVASGDPSIASSGALTAAAQLKQPVGFQALGNLFNDWTQTYTGNQVQQANNGTLNNQQPWWSFGQPQAQGGSMNIVA